MNAPADLAAPIPDVLGRLRARAVESRAPENYEVVAAALIADVSGFTALTATLEARHGARGADILSAMMDKLLGALSEIAGAHGGLVVDVIGDAIHALWIADAPATIDSARIAAVNAAVAMLAYAKGSADAQSTVPIRIGVACGPVNIAVVGGYAGRWETLAVGPALFKAGEAVSRAPTNRCQIGGDAKWGAIATIVQAETFGDGWWLLAPPETHLGHLSKVYQASAAPFDAMAWSAELRSVTVMFVRLVRAEDLIDVSVNEIHQLTRMVQELIEAHGGLVDKIHADDKGVSMVIAFGIQGGISTTSDIDRSIGGGTALRAVVAALDLRWTLTELGADTAIGIATGKVRVGIGNTDQRSAHTMYGHAVNVAARCMQACRNEILCDDATRIASADAVTFFAPEARQLKGLDNTGHIYGVGSIREQRDIVQVGDNAAIAGRKAEQSIIEQFLDTGAVRTSSVMIIEGDNGIGKSRLAAFAIETAEHRNIAIMVCRSGLLGTRTPLFAWRDPLIALLKRRARSLNLTETEIQSQLIDAIGASSEDLDIVGTLFGRDAIKQAVGDKDIDPAHARQVRAAAAAQLFNSEPRLIVFEDAQWLDDISIQLARDLGRRVPALKLIFVTRNPVNPALLKLGSDTNPITRTVLPPLDRHTIAEMATNLIGHFDVKHPFVDWLHARSTGNPMFCRALIALLPSDMLAAAVSAPGAWRKAQGLFEFSDMPATIEGALLQRFSGLPASQLGVLKAASVVGGTFDSALLIAMGTPATAEQLEVDFFGLAEAGILAPAGVPGKHSWRFADELAREVVYASLPKQLMVELHARAARYFERPANRQRFELAAQIAHHWMNAERPAQAFAPLRRAGVQAKQAGAYADAAALWKQALALIDKDQAGVRGKGRFHRAVLHRDLAFASWRLGEPQTTIEHCYQSLEGLWPGAPKSRSGWAVMLARETALLGWQIVVPKIRKARGGPAQSRVKDWLRLNNSVRLIEAFYFSKGALPAAAIGVYAARTAERIGETAYAARPYGFLGYLAGARGLDRVAQFCFNRPRRDCLKKRDWSSLAQSVHGETMYLLSNGRWKNALRRARFGRTLARRLSENADTGNITTLMGMGHLMAGSFATLRTTMEQVETIAYAKANDHYLLFSNEAIGQVELALGAPQKAEPLLIKAQALAKRVRDLQSALIAEGLLANTLLQLGHVNDVIEMSEALVAQAEATPMVNFGTWYGFGAVAETMLELYARSGPGSDGVYRKLATRAVAVLNRFARRYPVGAPRARLLSGQLEALNGNPTRAVKYWQAGIRMTEPLEMKHDLARFHSALSQSAQLDSQTRKYHTEQSLSLMAACGVSSLPPFSRMFHAA